MIVHHLSNPCNRVEDHLLRLSIVVSLLELYLLHPLYLIIRMLYLLLEASMASIEMASLILALLQTCHHGCVVAAIVSSCS